MGWLLEVVRAKSADQGACNWVDIRAICVWVRWVDFVLCAWFGLCS